MTILIIKNNRRWRLFRTLFISISLPQPSIIILCVYQRIFIYVVYQRPGKKRATVFLAVASVFHEGNAQHDENLKSENQWAVNCRKTNKKDCFRWVPTLKWSLETMQNKKMRIFMWIFECKHGSRLNHSIARRRKKANKKRNLPLPERKHTFCYRIKMHHLYSLGTQIHNFRFFSTLLCKVLHFFFTVHSYFVKKIEKKNNKLKPFMSFPCVCVCVCIVRRINSHIINKFIFSRICYANGRRKKAYADNEHGSTTGWREKWKWGNHALHSSFFCCSFFFISSMQKLKQ